MEQQAKKINFSIHLFPILSGLTNDILFWSVINTLYLTTIKHLSVVQISSLTTLSILVIVLFQHSILKLIQKIGNKKSVQVGCFLQFLTVILFISAPHYFFLLLGQIFYEIAFLFKSMDTIILDHNLKWKNQEDHYLQFQTRKTFIYSIATLVVTLLSGFLFPISPYFVMGLDLLLCFSALILSCFFYEAPTTCSEETNKTPIKLQKVTLLILILFSVIYATITLGQTNTKILLQLNLGNLYTLKQLSLYFSLVLIISRIVRILSNFIFEKITNKMTFSCLYWMIFFLISAFLFIIAGNEIQNGWWGIGIMAIGFFIFLAIRDPFQNYMLKLLMVNCQKDEKKQAIFYYTFFLKLAKLGISTGITLLLLRFSMTVVMSLLGLLSIACMIPLQKLRKIRKDNRSYS